ncbi:24048_t:CDS:10 [Dentiscutata erythropus]|uniref:24048_t:CDS:1 n=1 Tax=Dentiscutata erythropus TaxID=1348616 RepID=A0A9N9AF22_9GLOM|nr:24048_t:CDS:10 [Dentiscutata erythropus]
MSDEVSKGKEGISTTIGQSTPHTRPRRGTLSEEAKQTFVNATNYINQKILHRRTSVSSQKPIETMIVQTETDASANNLNSASPIVINNIVPSQQQLLQSSRTNNIPRRKNSRSPNSNYSPSPPLQPSFPLTSTAEEHLTETLDNINCDLINNINGARLPSNNIGNSSILKRLGTYSGNSSSQHSPTASISSRKANSLFTFDMNRENKGILKDDRMEKLLKKAKIFLDQRQKPKARITSLWSFIDVTNELDQAQFFQEHAEDVFDVVYKSFMGQVEKIKPEILSHLLGHGNHPRVRIQGFQLLLLWLNDQTIELQECIYLYSNAISLDLFLYDQIRNGGDDYYERQNAWRKSNVPLGLGQELIRSDNQAPLFPNPHPPTYNDAVQLIQLDLSSLVRLAHVAAGSTPPSENYDFPAIENIEPDNGIAIGMGIDAAFAAAKFHFDLTKKHYFVKLFPQCAKSIGLLAENQEYGFKKCPPTILRALITFFIHHCLDNHHSPSEKISSYPSPATPILKSIVLGPENREFAHEIVRQALMLPAGSPLYKDIVRGAVHIVGVWILSGVSVYLLINSTIKEEERPAFLRKSPSQGPLSASTTGSFNNHTSSVDSQSENPSTPAITPSSATSFSTTYSSANVYLRRYIQLLSLVFEDHSFMTLNGMTNLEVDSQVSIYKDVLALYRSMISEGPIELETETWEVLLLSLLDIQDKIMNQKDKYAAIPSASLAEELADYLVETVLNAFARSKAQQPGLWKELRDQMSCSTRWSQTISQWAKIMLRLTKIISKHVYNVDLDALELDRRLAELSTSERHYHRRRPSKNRTRHLSLRGTHKHKSSGSTSSREEVLGALNADFSLSAKNTTDNNKCGRRTLSMHQDMNSLDPKLLSGQTLFNVVGSGPASSTHSAESKSHRTSSSSVFFAHPNFSGEKLSISLGNFRCPDYCNLDPLAWNGESAVLVWRNMLCALGNVASNHADAIKCLVDMLEMLELVRNNKCGNFSLSLHYDFAPWLFQACDLPLTFTPGRALAYAGLCKMMSQRQDQDFDEAFYPHFYRALLKGFSEQDISITLAIVNNFTKLFSRGLPGYSILCQSFIEAIRNMLLKNDKHIPEVARQNAIKIICSLICIVNQTPTVKVPIISYENLVQFNNTDLDASELSHFDSMRFSEVRLLLEDALISSLADETSVYNYETHNMLLYGIFTFAFDELTATPWPDKTIVKECFQAILEQLYWSHLPIVSAATDCLISFAQNSSLWCDENGIYIMILQEVFAYLIGALNEHLNLHKTSSRNGRGFIIAKLFYCLLEWLMVIPTNLFTDTELCQLVFDVIDMALEASGSDSPRIYRKHCTNLSNKGSGKSKDRDFTVKFKKAERKVALNSTLDNEQNIHVVGVENDVEDVNFVKVIISHVDFMLKSNVYNGFMEVAEYVLLHLTHHLDNFAPLHGPAMMNSTLIGPLGSETKDDEASDNYHYFSFNDTTIITLVEIPGDNSSVSRMIIRDFSGRYAWDSSLFYKASLDDKYPEKVDTHKDTEVIDHISLRPDIKVEPSNSKPKSANSSPKIKSRYRPGSFFKDKNRLPVWTETSSSEHINMLDNLLQYIDQQSPCTKDEEGLPSTSLKIVNGLSLIEEQLDRHIQEETLYESSINNQAKLWYDNIISVRNNIFHERENRHVKRRSRNPLYTRSTSYLSLGADFSLSKSFIPVLPPEAEKPIESYQLCRLFLSHLGWLNPEALKDDSICMLNKTPNLFRDIRFLDKKHAREVIKVALLYVGPGQENEKCILHNTNGSPLYDEFVASLGWEIELATHPGYLGGLERNATNGLTSIYYCTSTIEIIFHDVTRMPTDLTDPKQLKKKRHIGNDHVHIVFNEHHRDYRKTTIGGDFGNAQIVVTPLPNGLFSIDIYRDNKIPPFGPLLHGMVVSKNVLGPLVRQTAVQAFRNSLRNLHSSNITMYHNSYMERASDISLITGKHKNPNCNTFEAFMSKFFVSDYVN